MRVDAIVINDGTNNFGTPINTEAPVDLPEFYRVPINDSSVYLGNGWAITARHAEVPSTIVLGDDANNATYEVIPGSAISLSNPDFDDDVIGLAAGVSLSSLSDIELFRVRPNGFNGLTPEQADSRIDGTLGIASQTASLSTQVTFVSNGNTRGINTDPNDGIPADTVNASGIATVNGFQGIPNQGPSVRSFGRNRIARDSLIEADGGTDGDNVFAIRVQGARDIVGQLTQFSLPSVTFVGDDAAVQFEAQAAADDSGGAVFVEENGETVLAGVLHAISTFPGQPGRIAGVGNATIFSDLSQGLYRDQISALLSNDFEQFELLTGRDIGTIGYSIDGDVNLDGIVSGDGTGDPATDDLAAFISGFGNIELDGEGLLLENGSLESWRQGDLNLDGATNLADFAILRDALNGSVSNAQLSSVLSLISGQPVPEPSAAVLLISAMGVMAARRTRRVD